LTLLISQSRGHCRRVTDGYPIFRAMARAPVDFFLFVGDTIYSDHVCDGPEFVPGSGFVAKTLPQYHAKHRYNRADAGLQAYFRQTSVFAIWDDHEVANDFSGSGDPRMLTGRQAFIDYFPIVPPREEPGRLYRRFRWGKLLEVFILDTRQYRSANSDVDGPGKTMLGRAQRRWLVEGVSGSTALWKIVVTSVSLSVPTGRGARDSWSNANVWGFPDESGTGFAVERDAILRALRGLGVKNLVFLAADVHHAELIRHHPTPEWSFHEFIAGPLSASLGRPRPVDQALNPRSLWALGSVENFGVIAMDAASLTVRIIDVDGQVRHPTPWGPTARLSPLSSGPGSGPLGGWDQLLHQVRLDLLDLEQLCHWWVRAGPSSGAGDLELRLEINWSRAPRGGGPSPPAGSGSS
jgi:alkaline phosphatase D